MSIFKKFTASLLALCICCTMLPITTFATGSSSTTESNSDVVFSGNNFSAEDRIFFEKMSLVFDGYTTTETGEIIFTYSNTNLTKLGFNENEVARLNALNETICGVVLTGDSSVTTRIHVEGGKVWFTYDDVMAFLFAAASVGPSAMYAALVALGSVSLGPAGTAITAIVGIIGAPSLASFCYQVIQAVANKQGVYIGIEMNGIFPNIVSGTW